MPTKLPKPCKQPGCGSLTSNASRFCNDHQASSRTVGPDTKFYNSETWRRLRQLHLHQQPLCVDCGADGTVVDHIKQIRMGGSRLDLANLQTLCDSCHNKKRSQESRSIVY